MDFNYSQRASRVRAQCVILAIFDANYIDGRFNGGHGRSTGQSDFTLQQKAFGTITNFGVAVVDGDKRLRRRKAA